MFLKKVKNSFFLTTIKGGALGFEYVKKASQPVRFVKI